MKCSTIRAARGDVSRRERSPERDGIEKEGQREMRKTGWNYLVVRIVGNVPLRLEERYRGAFEAGLSDSGPRLAGPGGRGAR